jgi:hypothetical protein
MNTLDKDAAENIAVMKKLLVALRARRIGAKMFCGALLCSLAAMRVQAMEEFQVNYKLVGVTSVRYRMFIEHMFGNETDCKIDDAEWEAAMDRVTSQSNELRFVSHQAEFNEDEKRMKKEESEGKCHLDIEDHDDGLPSCFSLSPPRKPMPELNFSVNLAKIENTCLAEVAAKLSDDIVGETKFKTTGRDSSVTSAQMWSSTYWIKKSEENIGASVIEVSENMMKDLLYEWTRANCSDCDFIGDGGAPPKWVDEGRQWFTWRRNKVGAGIEQDDANLAVVCDPSAGRALHPDSRGLILIFLHEPRANWPKDAKVAVMTTSDDGTHWPTPGYGIAIESTTVMLKNAATWELNVMGHAEESLTIRVGPYTRTFPAANLRKAVEPVLHECGDDW